MTESPVTRGVLFTLATLAALWGALGVAESGRRATAGYDAGADHVVVRVETAGPADAAGLRRGDVIRSIDGVSLNDAAGLAQLGRAELGETRMFVVEREGAAIALRLEYGRPGPRQRIRSRVDALVGFGFIGLCAWAWLVRPVQATRVLAIIGIGLGLAFLPGPGIEAPLARALASVARNALVLAGTAALLHFLLLFPAPRPFLAKPGRRRLLYLPAGLFWLLVSWRILFAPPSGGGLDTLTGILAGLVLGGYLVLCATTLLRAWIRASAAERGQHGLNAMLWCAVLGLLPQALGVAGAVLEPQAGWPGRDFYGLSLVLIPLSWSWAAQKKARP